MFGLLLFFGKESYLPSGEQIGMNKVTAYYFLRWFFRSEEFLYIKKVKGEPVAPVKSCGSQMCNEWLRFISAMSKK